MFNIERWQEIFEAIAKNRLRTFLTGISVASGIFILVILLGVGNGLQNGIQQQFEGDATDLIEVWTGVTSKEYKGLNPGRRIQLRNSDYNMAVQRFDDQINLRSASVTNWGTALSYKKENGNYQYRGVFPDHQGIENATMVEGRFINQNDVARVEKVGAIGMKIKLDLFKDQSPLGEIITVDKIPFKVIGVFTDPAGEREESRIYIPISTAQKVFGKGDVINNMAYTLKKHERYEDALAESNAFTSELTALLQKKNTVAPDDVSAINVNSSIENQKQFYDLNLYMSLFFWWVGICTIIAGVVGVSNIMLIIVKERTKEIGIRKALGAPPSSIIAMILHESIFLTTISGFVGLLTSLLLLEIVGPMIDSDYFVNPQVDFKIAITTLILLVFAGAVAGFFPAYRAAKIKPIVALRDE